MICYKKAVCACVSLLLASLAYAKQPAVQLVLDARNAPALPRHFRALPAMYMAGGAQFSEMGLKKIKEELHAKRMTVIDLRQESHGFLDGNAVSWYGFEDAANAGKTPKQINQDQRRRLASLKAKKRVIIHRVLKKSADGAIASVKPIEFMVRQVLSEEALTHQFRLNYQRIYIQDFHAPSDRETDRFIQIIQSIPAHQWIYFHCHAGVGRTTTAMVMFDMMQHAKKESFDAILAREKEMGGKDLTMLPNAKSFKLSAAKDRMAFLRKFYQYARDNTDDFETSWSEWLKRIDQ